MNDFIAVVCPNCGDTWSLEQITNLDSNTYFGLMSQSTDCHRCGNQYQILSSLVKMIDWVFWKVKTVKGEE